jgi:CRISPR system Cascade subunit CasA
MNNLLRDPLIRIETSDGVERLSLPGVFAALVADRVESFPALRAHQAPAWHMFQSQLGAVAMHRAGLTEPPEDAAKWLEIIQALTKDEFPGDEPWQLVVADRSRPAFMQPPVPDGITLDSVGATPDALDMLITSKNHDIKQAVATSAGADDWIFAMVNLQTCEGYGGSGNYGVARMNGGSSSRALVGLAPMVAAAARSTGIRVGTRLTRDVTQLVARRAALLEGLQVGYPNEGGLALLWTLPWPQGAKLSLAQLDPYFVEICRRIRLGRQGETLSANIGTSSASRINAEAFKGAIGDPWAPVHVLENKALTLGDEGEFDYKRIVELMFSGNWTPPMLATLGPGEDKDAANWVLIVQAFARGNSKTGGSGSFR